MALSDADMLGGMFRLQEELQAYKLKEVGFNRQEYINMMALAMVREVGEALEATAWKNPEFVKYGWKKGQVLDIKMFKDELVDVLHFFLNLCIAAEMGPVELHKRFVEKNKANMARWENGY